MRLPEEKMEAIIYLKERGDELNNKDVGSAPIGITERFEGIFFVVCFLVLFDVAEYDGRYSAR